MKSRSIAAALGLLLTAASACAQLIFAEDFEFPEVSGYVQSIPGLRPVVGWIGANEGFNSTHHGLVNKDGGDFSAPDPNHQGYAFRYTNSGLTTAEDVLDDLQVGVTYTVSFDVVRDDGLNAGTRYNVQLVAFAPGVDRDDVRSIPAGSTLLDSRTGDAPTDGSFEAVSFSFTSDAVLDAADIGKDLGIRLVGATSSAIIDNVRLEVDFPMLVAPAYRAWLDAGDIDLTWNNLPANVGPDTWVDVWFGTDPGALSQVVDAGVDGPNRTTVTVSAPVDDTYYWRVDSYLEGSATGTPVTGNLFVFQVGVPPQPGDDILPAVTALRDHITGAAPLTAGEIEDLIATLEFNLTLFGVDGPTIAGCLDLVQTYDSVIGPIWVSGSPKAGGFTRSSISPDIHWAVYTVMQSIMDDIYKADVLAAHEGLLDGYSFGSAANFPGSVTPPGDPGNTHTATISGSYEDTFGRATQGDGPGTFARKPTGTYLAPGTIATVTVPASLVDAGYQVRVGCHSWDFSNKPSIKRLDRISRAFPIDALQTKVANPLGGGIYIEVPFGANAGVVSVDVTGAVRSPYFSAKSFHTTTLGEWQTTERNFPAPWADFQTDKFMMQVPTSWIYALDDPATLLADWDAAMDSMNELMGFPFLRGKETMYPQVDILLRASVFAPGYPSVNTADNPNNDRGGWHTQHLVRGPQFASDYEFHEQGHGYLFPKFGGESESNVNLHHVAVQHRAFGDTLDHAFASSRGFGGNPNRTLDNTAVAWMCVFNFSPREVPMASGEKAYQLKGHAKFVDIVRLFGWGGLDEFWRSYMEDEANGTLPANPTSTDNLLLRMCRSVGKDIRPLFHFWGIHPDDPAALRTAVLAEGFTPSPEILAQLEYYKTLIPADNAAFQTFAVNWWGQQPSINGFWTEREHARQWDTEELFGAGDQQRPNGEIYVEASAASIEARVQEIIELYDPSLDGTPPSPDPMSFAMAPAETGPDSILMTATTAEDGNGVEYYFECLTAGGHDSGWQASPTYTDTVLSPNTEYTYRVRARDQSPAQNTTAFSADAAATTGGSLPPGTLFAEGFEVPDVPDYSENTVPYNVVPTNVTWVGATQGFGATRRGLTDKAGGDFSAPDPNQQAYAFRYTNSGLTTAQGVIGSLTEDTTYTLSFDVVRDDGLSAGTPYRAELVAFDPADDNAARTECRGARPGTILAIAAGDAPGDGTFATISLDFTPDAGTHAADFDKDLGIRFVGATTTAIIDNVLLTSVDPGGGNNFADWIAGFDVGGLTGFADDFDLDGNGNAVENFLGTHPGVFSAGLVSGTVTGGTFTFTHPQNPTPADDLTAAYRWSKDIDSFHADGATDGDGTTVDFTAQLDTPAPGITTVTATVSGTSVDKLFVDVEVMQIP